MERATPLKMQFYKVNILWMSKLKSAFVVMHLHTEIICWIAHIKNSSGSLEPTFPVTGGYDPSLPRFIIVATWSALEMSAYQQIQVHCQLHIFAAAGTGLQEGFRSLKGAVDRMPRLINHQLVPLRRLMLTKSKWPNGVLGFIGTVYGTVEVQPVKHPGRSHHLSSKTHEMFLNSMVHISFIHLLSTFYVPFLQC